MQPLHRRPHPSPLPMQVAWPLDDMPQTLAARNAHGFLRGAERHGLDVAALLQRHGLPALLAVPGAPPMARCAIAPFAQVLRGIRHRLRDEFIGLASAPVPPGTMMLALERMVQAPTLQRALEAGFAVYRLACRDFRARLCTGDDGSAGVQLLPAAGAAGTARTAAATFLESVFLYGVVGIASWLVQQRVPVRGLWLRGSGMPAWYAAQHGQPVFGVPALFHEAPSRVSFDAAWLQQSVVADSAALPAFLAATPANLLAPFRAAETLGERVRLRLRAQLGSDMPSLEQTAWSLRLTPHTLRRRLADEGRCFQDIKNELRRDAAVQLLLHSTARLEDIAEHVGFSECSTFHRSFKLWTGLAPGEYRRAHRQD